MAKESIDFDWTQKLDADFSSVRANRVARNAVTAANVNAAARDITRMRSYHDTYGISRKKTGDITNQRQSGRCWMFATFNTLRAATMELLDVDTFEFSQSFGMFYDKLEKANSMLENIIATADQDADSREVAFILEDGMGDGGYVPYAMNIVQKYGLVPKDAMPETACSKNSSQMDQQLERLLHKDSLELRRMHADGKSDDELRERKVQMLVDVHRVLCVCLGEPPVTFDFECQVGKDAKADASMLFAVEPEDKPADKTKDGADSDAAEGPEDAAKKEEKKDARLVLRDKGITPRQFAERYVPVDPTDWVDLVSMPDPKYPFGEAFHIRYMDSILDGQKLHSLNCPMEVLEDAAIRSLKAGVPVAMACDVMQDFPRSIDDYKYVLGTDTMDFEGLFGVDLSMGREDLVAARETCLTHEMTFQGVELGEDGRPVAWRIENSWGKDAGKDGYLIMSGDWFRTYGGNVTVRREFVDEATLKAWDTTPVREVEPWSNLGRCLAARK